MEAEQKSTAYLHFILHLFSKASDLLLSHKHTSIFIIHLMSVLLEQLVVLALLDFCITHGLSFIHPQATHAEEKGMTKC